MSLSSNQSDALGQPFHFEPLAIIGMDCRLPQAETLIAYEDMLFTGRSGVSELPPQMLDKELYFDSQKGNAGKTYTSLGGTVNRRLIDLSQFGLDKKQSEQYDQVHLRFCEVALRAWAHAGLLNADQDWKRTGVYVGHSGATDLGGAINLFTQIEEALDLLNENETFQKLGRSSQQTLIDQVTQQIRASRPRRNQDFIPRYNAQVAALLPANILGLTGPRVVTDAACASSLFSMQQAMLAISAGRIDAAIVGGATGNSADNLILFSQSQACSASATCPFDNSASGLISSEGYVAVVVTTLSKALRSGKQIYGVVERVGVSCDGRGKSLWAPRAEGQQLAMQRAYEKSPLDVDYLEAHATSTQLGDATELESVSNVRKASQLTVRPLLMGSAKSNLGHTLESAGLVGLIKVMLGMKRNTIPPTINFGTPNERFDWKSNLIQVVAQPTAWSSPNSSRRAGVNAFGIGGLNAHVCLSEPSPQRIAELEKTGRQSTAGSQQLEQIAIIGRGVILPGANNIAEFKALLESGESMIGPPPEERWRASIGVGNMSTSKNGTTPTSRGGYIRDYKFDSQAYRIPPKQVQQSNPIQMMLLDAVTQVITEVDNAAWDIDTERAGVIVGAIFGGEFSNQLQLGLRLPEIEKRLVEAGPQHGLTAAQSEELAGEFRKTVLKQRPALLDETGSFTASTLASRIAKTFNLMGGACAVDAGDSSSFAGLALAVDQLRSGAWETAIVGGAQRSMDLSAFEEMHLKGKLLASGDPNEIPADGSQVLPGEGVVVLMLERLSTAKSKGHKILGVIEDISQHYADAQTADADLVRQIGYLSGAQGMIEIVKQTLQETPIPQAEFYAHADDGTGYVVNFSSGTNQTPLITPEPVKELKQTFTMLPRVLHTPADCGTIQSGNCHSASTSITRSNSVVNSNTPFSEFRFSGSSPQDLLQQVEDALREPTRTFNSPTQSDSSGPIRATVLAENPEGFAKSLTALKQRLLGGNTRTVAEKERVVCWQDLQADPSECWLFPGQGSRTQECPTAIESGKTARSVLNQIDEILEQLGHPPISPEVLAPHPQIGNDIWKSQIWVFAATTALMMELKSQGVGPDLVIGHSFGEYSALVAAGVLSLESAVKLVRTRADAVTATVREAGGLLSIRGSLAEVDQVLRKNSLQATITHQNAPKQTVIAVSQEHLKTVQQALLAANLASMPIPVPVAYHTDRLQQTAAVLQRSISGVRFLPPRCGLISPTLVEYVAEPHRIVDCLITQLTRPVLYVPTVERLVADNVGLFVEVGPNSVLTRLNREIIGNRAICFSFDSPGRSLAESVQLLNAIRRCVRPNTVAHSFVTNSNAPVSTQSLAQASRSNPINSNDVEVVDVRTSKRAMQSAPQVAASQKQVAPASQPLPVQEVQQQVVSTPQASSKQVLSFLMNLTLELTGYSEDVVDYEADLEADLGIDSIKKAQMIGEVSECFGLNLKPQDIRLDDFKSLNDIATLVETTPASTVTTTTTPTSPQPILVEETSFTSASTEISLSEISAPDFSTSEFNAVEPASQLTNDNSFKETFQFDEAQAAQFLMDIVIDQTGYSPEIVDLDAELEADLGVDSIKQAQLLGEVQQQYSMQLFSAERTTLSQFPTLRSILNFLVEKMSEGDDGSSPTNEPSEPTPTKDIHTIESNGSPNGYYIPEPKLTYKNGTAKSHTSNLPKMFSEICADLFSVGDETGNSEVAYELGKQQGAQNQSQIRAALREMIDTGLTDNGHRPAQRTPVLEGLAQGAGVAVESVQCAVGLLASNHDVHAETHCDPTKVETDKVNSCTTSAVITTDVTAAPLDDNQTMRFAMRMIAAPQRTGMPQVPKLVGPALILGDNDLADALARQIEASGTDCHRIQHADSIDNLESQLNAIWQNEITPHLFLTTPCDPDALSQLDLEHWQQRRLMALEVPYRTCQLWMERMVEANRMDGASVVALTNLGGDLGFGNHPQLSPEGGLGGLIKAICIEGWMRGFRSTSCKVIDISPETSPPTAAKFVLQELAVPSYDIEVACHEGQRFTVQPVHAPLKTPESKTTSNGHAKVTRGGTWVVTGGGRGITAVVAMELAKKHQLKLHLLGRAPVPNISIEIQESAKRDRSQLRRNVMFQASERGENGIAMWRDLEKGIEIEATLKACREHGITATYHACDVSDADSLSTVLDAIRLQDGKISGVIHGAGVGQDARFDRKRADKVNECLRAKIDGCLNLMSATTHDDLEWFVAFGSISGRFGANGHTDYSLANDMLSKLVDRFRLERPNVPSTTFHWHAWGDIGMATKPETRLSLEMIEMEFMPAVQGLAHFINELEHGGDESEVLITDRAYYRKFLPVGRLISDESAVSANVGVLPMLGEQIKKSPSQPHEIILDADERFLSQHLVQGVPTLPFVFAIEMQAEAARLATQQTATLRGENVIAHQAIKVANDSLPIKIHSQVLNSKSAHCKLTADVRRRDGRMVEEDRVYFEGQWTSGMPQSLGQQTWPDLSKVDWREITYVDRDASVFHGPDFQCLRKIAITGNSALGILSASSPVQLGGGTRPVRGWSIHPAAMDACLYATAVLAWNHSQRVSLPVKFGQIDIGRLPDPGESCLIQTRIVETHADRLVTEFELIGLNAEVLMKVKGYELAWIR